MRIDSPGLRGVSNGGRCSRKRHRGFSHLVFDQLRAMASTVAAPYTDRWSRHVKEAERDGDLYKSRERCSGRGRQPQASHRHRCLSHLCSRTSSPSHHLPSSQQSAAEPLEKFCNHWHRGTVVTTFGKRGL